MSDRAHGFIAGVILGCLVALLLISFIACQTARARTASTWSIITPGTTMIETPCGVILIEIRANTEMTVFYWRIAVIPKVVTVPQKPEKVPPSA